MIGMLHAIPKTPLYERLLAEGRVDREDPPMFGTNVIPAQMTREELRDGYIHLLRDLYEPDAYFQRLDALYLKDRFRFGTARSEYWKRHLPTGLAAQARNFATFALVARRLMRDVPHQNLRTKYRRQLWKLIKTRADPAVLLAYAIKCAMHYHHYRMSQEMACDDASIVSTI
jgi:hypothetical protein